jgi:hypothetical protein
MSPQMLCCRVCGSDMRSRSLLPHYSLKPYRVCPDCNGKYTEDSKTKKRQIPIRILALTAMGLTFAASAKGLVWLLPAVVSHIVLWACVGYVLSKLVYVQYPD